MSIQKSILKVALVGLVTIGSFGFVNAQEVSESHIAAAKRMIAATSSTQRLDSILPQSADAVKNSLIRNRPDQEAVITDVVDLAALELAPRRGDLESEVAQIFTRIFTEDELNTVSAFYETEAGKKFLTESPIALREISGAARVWSNGIQRDLAANSNAKLKEMGLQ
ncbi:MAG: DUF2059 domain-containing protein [Nitratireductor sp.]